MASWISGALYQWFGKLVLKWTKGSAKSGEKWKLDGEHYFEKWKLDGEHCF